MKLLWVKAGGLLPPDMGGKIRSYQILKQLAQRHAITLFTYYPAHPHDLHAGGAELFQKIIAVPLPLPSYRTLAEYARYARLLGTGRAYTIEKYFYYPEVRRSFRALMESSEFDVIVCDFIYPAPLIDWHAGGAKKILFTHNVEAQIWERYYKVARNPVWKTVCWLESRTLSRAERHYVPLADGVLTVSEQDRSFFAQYAAPERLFVIPTGVDTEYFQPAGAAPEPNTLVFTGAMDWMPNEDGVTYFVEKVFPMIQQEIKKARFFVVGHRPPKRIQALASENVVVTGSVADIRPYLARAAVVVVPLRSGSGTRIKIFEAMAMGKAVVSTTLGAEGLPVRTGENIMLADDPAVFAQQTIGLLRDAERREQLERAARRLVEENYGWPAVGEYFDRIIEDLASRAHVLH
jgi:polysaccharide biosynthesis protein PslH